MICADPELLKLDADMEALYAERFARVSSRGKQSLREDQKRWLIHLGKACEGKNLTAGCLSAQYTLRLDEIRALVFLSGSHVLTISTEEKVSADGNETTSISVPQFDRTHNKSEEEFNSFVWTLVGEGGCEENNNNLSVKMLGDHIISLIHEKVSACVGGSQALGIVDNVIVDFKGHPKVLDKINPFQLSDEAQLKMKRLFLAASNFVPENETDTFWRDNNLEKIYDYSHWLPVEEGLKLQFWGTNYRINGEGSKTIPWSDIKPLLPLNSPLWRFINAKR